MQATPKSAAALAVRGAGAFAAYKFLGSKVPGGPIVAALLGWIIIDFVLDQV